jgi:hypothetical protein
MLTPPPTINAPAVLAPLPVASVETDPVVKFRMRISKSTERLARTVNSARSAHGFAETFVLSESIPNETSAGNKNSMPYSAASDSHVEAELIA